MLWVKDPQNNRGGFPTFWRSAFDFVDKRRYYAMTRSKRGQGFVAETGCFVHPVFFTTFQNSEFYYDGVRIQWCDCCKIQQFEQWQMIPAVDLSRLQQQIFGLTGSQSTNTIFARRHYYIFSRFITSSQDYCGSVARLFYSDLHCPAQESISSSANFTFTTNIYTQYLHPIFTPQFSLRWCTMTIDKSLKVKAGSVKNRNVLTRAERYQKLVASGQWNEESTVIGMPKVRVEKLALKKKKKVKTDEESK